MAATPAICASCGAEVAGDRQFCSACGTRLEVISPSASATEAVHPDVAEPPAGCRVCGEPLRSTSKFCVECGAPIDESSAEEPAVVTTPTTSRVPARDAVPKLTASESSGTEWTATHRVPPSGLKLYAEPDAESPPNGKLAPGVPLEVVRVWGAWAQIRLGNGWSGWVDGRKLKGRTA